MSAPNRLLRMGLQLGVALLLAACSPDSNSNQQSGSSQPSTPPAQTPPAQTPPAQTPPAQTPPAQTPPPGGTFSYTPVGQLVPASAGTGDPDPTVWNPTMRFPLRCAPAYANSQVYNPGGQEPGGFCDDSNYQYPWHDNFCEKRPGADTQTSWMCPTYKDIHQGQDIRADTRCSNKGTDATTGTFYRSPADGLYKTKYQIVAVDDGVISYVGSYSVYLDVLRDGQPERKYTYLHMNMDEVKNLYHIAAGVSVTKGQVIGTLSNQFHLDSNGKPIPDDTTPHLHFEIQTSATGTDGHSHFTWVSPYMTLVTAYQALLAAGNASDCPP